MVRNESSIIFTTKNESGTQLELACGEKGDFAVRYGTGGNWTSSGPMSQLTLKVGSDEFSPDQTFFESLSNLPPSSKIVVLQMGHEYGSFSSHGLSELLKGDHLETMPQSAKQYIERNSLCRKIPANLKCRMLPGRLC
ncbi:Uncharacterised protein [Yersinia intermedia]|nr:Uncharacterised protein [Yersinia frederiksenii]CQJ56276.1 Uncharacterised protein [Yersinia intermedia]